MATPAPTPPAHRIPLPVLATALLTLSPFLMLFGGLTVLGTTRSTYNLANTPTMLGSVMFWVGVAALMSGLIIAGVRTVAQRHLEALAARTSQG